MDRRRFLTTAGVAGAGAIAAAATHLPKPAIAQGNRQIRMVMSWPQNSPGLGRSAQQLCDRITAMTGGRITFRVYAANELVPPFEVFDAVSAGQADMYHSADYYFQGKSPAFNFFTTVPYGLMSHELQGWLDFGGGQELWDELSAGFGVKPLPSYSTGTQMLGWFRKEINELDDLQGLRLRMPGLGGEVMRRLGVNVVNLPVTELFQALQSGAIDAVEWVGPYHDLAFGFHRITKNYYYPGFHEPGSLLTVGMNLKFWNDLPEEDRLIIQTAVQAEGLLRTAEFNARNQDALDTLISEHGVSLRRLPDPVLSEVRKISEQVLAETAERDDMTKRVYESFLAYREKAFAWGRLAEGATFAAREI